VTSNESPHKLTLIEIMHIQKRIIGAGGHPRLRVSELDIVDGKEVVLCHVE